MIARICSLLRIDVPNPDAVTGKLQSHGTTVPADGATGYETGCLFQKIDGGDGTSLYVNEGDVDSADFNAVTVGA